MLKMTSVSLIFSDRLRIILVFRGFPEIISVTILLNIPPAIRLGDVLLAVLLVNVAMLRLFLPILRLFFQVPFLLKTAVCEPNSTPLRRA